MAEIDSFQFLEKELIKGLNCVQDALAIYGAIHLIKNFTKISKIIKSIYLYTKGRNNLKENFGNYAVISSIDDDLGREIAINLAAKSINLIIFYDNTLDVEFIRSLSKKFNIEIQTVDLKDLKLINRFLIDKQIQLEINENLNIELNCLDKSNDLDQLLNDDKNSIPEEENEITNLNNNDKDEDLIKNIMQKDIGIFVNCTDYKQKNMIRFLSYSDQEINNLIYSNIIIPLKLHQLFFNKLIKRERGLIFNVTNNTFSTRPIPYLSIYSASKLFLPQLIETLEYEYGKHHNIIFKTLIKTYFTSYLFNNVKLDKQITHHDKKINKYRRLIDKLIYSLLPDKQKFISNLLEPNYNCKTTGYFLFDLEYYFLNCLPQSLFNLIIEIIFLLN